MNRTGLLIGAAMLGAVGALSACATTPKEPPTQTCPDGSVVAINVPCPPPPPPPPPPTQTCPDGSVILATSVCPAPPPPPPPPPPIKKSGERG